MLREINKREIEECRKRTEEIFNNGYRKIKPETDITVEECNAFWESLLLNPTTEEN